MKLLCLIGWHDWITVAEPSIYGAATTNPKFSYQGWDVKRHENYSCMSTEYAANSLCVNCRAYKNDYDVYLKYLMATKPNEFCR